MPAADIALHTLPQEESVLLVSASESTAASSAVASLAESAQGLDIIGEGDFVGG